MVRPDTLRLGEAVAASDGQRAHSGSGDDALVFFRELEHSSTQRVSLFDGEHRSAILAPPNSRARARFQVSISALADNLTFTQAELAILERVEPNRKGDD